MKERLLFLLKLLLFSAASFALWILVFARPYTLFLERSIGFLYPFVFNREASLKILSKVPYYYLVFLSLTLATPYTTVKRKIKLLLVGTLIFFSFDFLTTMLGITTRLAMRATIFDSALRALYYTFVYVLPISLWLVPNFNEMGRLFEVKADSGRESKFRCPICGKVKTGLVQHIRSAHGEKSLKSWRVKRFLAKQKIRG